MMNILGQEVRWRIHFVPRHAILLGGAILVGLSWHYIGLKLGWNGASALMRHIGWIVFPLSFVTGLGVIGFSGVLWIRRRDWRLIVGLLLAALGITIAMLDFFWAADRISQ